jgi:hypothetical protein
MRTVITVLTLFLCAITSAQTKISGKVTDKKGAPIEGANVYLEGTYDGASTNQEGVFFFETTETGEQALVVSFLSFETFVLKADVSTLSNLKIILKEEVNALTGVTLTAGTFQAGDNSKVSVLKPLDVVTTASAMGDFVGALQTLPGTSTVAEDGRLFVRGGSAEETQIFIDGIRVFTPFTPTTNNAPTRGRFSPFLFKGITFSTGGYSAEYGQALSSVLLLNSIDEPEQERTDISLMTVGAGLGNTQIWDKHSLSVNTSYINLAPYLELFKDRNDWKKPFETLAGEAVYRYKLENGIFKFYTALDRTNFKLIQEDINFEDGFLFGVKNRNFYANASYKGFYNNGWSLHTGASYSNTKNDVTFNVDDVDTNDRSYHVKATMKKKFSERLKLLFGTENFQTNYKETFITENGDMYPERLTSNTTAAYAETDVFFSNQFATKVGVRASYNNLLDEFTVQPRVSLAYKSGDNAQFSLAYGKFTQQPFNDYLKYDESLSSQKASHYLFNYQYSRQGQTFRAEVYYKKYSNLIKYDTDFAEASSNYNNLGKGYATGLDLFWRDNKSFKNFEYWGSYSYLDTERDHKNYPIQTTPNFAAKHNFSLVGKLWVEDWKSQIGATYNFASGRPYNNPNETKFMNRLTKSYNNVSFNWAYLLSPQKILFFSVNNVFGFKNVNGYQYANTPNNNGEFERRTLLPAADRFFFVGFFWTISDNKTDNQLDNL